MLQYWIAGGAQVSLARGLSQRELLRALRGCFSKPAHTFSFLEETAAGVQVLCTASTATRISLEERMGRSCRTRSAELWDDSRGRGEGYDVARASVSRLGD